jgi:hypothetical protein
MLTLVLKVWLMASIVDGGGQEIAISGEVLQKGLVKLGLSLASPDACLLPKDLHVEAHLLDLLSDAGAPPIAGGNGDRAS